MKKCIILIAVLVFTGTGVLQAGSLSIQDYHLGVKFLNVGGDASYQGIRNTSFGVYGQVSGSLVDMLLQSFGVSGIRFGDYFGTYGTLSGAIYEDQTRFPLFMNIGLLGGGFAAISLGDEIDLGAKVYYDLRLDLFDYSKTMDFVALMVTPMVRFQEFYLDGSFSITPGAPMFALAGRYLSGDGMFVGLRFERSVKTFSTTREDVHTGLTVTLGQAF